MEKLKFSLAIGEARKTAAKQVKEALGVNGIKLRQVTQTEFDRLVDELLMSDVSIVVEAIKETRNGNQ